MANEYSDWSADDFPKRMIYEGECGSMWNQIGPANWRVKWKGDVNILAEIAFRRFGPHLEYAVSATAIRVDEDVEVTMCFRDPPPPYRTVD